MNFDWISVVVFIFIGGIAVVLSYQIFNAISERKFKEKSLLVSESNNEASLSGFQLMFSPFEMVKAIQKVSPKYTKRHYTQRLMVGIFLGMVIMYILYRSILLGMAGAMIFAFLYPYLDLVKYQELYRNEIKEKLIHYFKLFSSYMRSTNYNISKSLTLSIEGIQEPLRSDLEVVLFDLKQGSSGKKAFQSFNEKYPYHGVELFHHLAILIAEQGGDDHDSLKEAANRFAEKKYWQNKLEQNNKKLLRDRKGVVLFSLFIFIMMMGMTSEYYSLFIASIVGLITVTLSLLWYALTFYSQKGLLAIDPTELKK